MLESWGDLEFLRHVFENTEIVRKPLIGRSAPSRAA